ncbi:hypothetical protein CEXT_651971 [Caerostris extrusa]|uniref:Uncharacterized protein n=1 Tax=Caerostris extrusa TaxID=172846 RepID=A0AAV4WVI9_CAEEX|nr:hypothetical protein CEXT_651971 [Caerostris extrusa]
MRNRHHKLSTQAIARGRCRTLSHSKNTIPSCKPNPPNPCHPLTISSILTPLVTSLRLHFNKRDPLLTLAEEEVFYERMIPIQKTVPVL